MTEARNSLTATILRNRIPELTLAFWLIKVLTTTSGETVADWFNETLGFGLGGTTLVMGGLLAAALVWQFSTRRLQPAAYWSVVLLISIFGTLVTDNLTDGLGVPLWISTVVFGSLLAVTFTIWFLRERTLSIKEVFTRRREAFYWVAILFTFAMGTAVGDLVSEGLGLGYFWTTILVVGIIGVVVAAWKYAKFSAVASFWIAYVLTRPLGASLGDLLSQAPKHGGLGLGAYKTSAIFFAAIAALVVWGSIKLRRQREAVAALDA